MDEDLRGRFRRDEVAKPVRQRRLATAVRSESPAPSRRLRKLRFKNSQLVISAVVLAIVFVGGVGLVVWRISSDKSRKVAQNQQYFPSTITNAQINVPVYYPENLPSGYTVGSFSIIQKNVLSYLVTDGSGDKFYVTIQALPVNFDFVGFAKKFPQSDQYSTPIGSDLVGVAGGNLIGSVQTNQNAWIILNSSDVDAIKNMETITRAFRQVSL